MREVSLDCLTLTDASPLEVIDAAHQAGFALVSLWVQAPTAFPRQLLTPDMERAVAARLADTGVRLGALEVFDLISAEQVASFAPALERGARLGARAAVAVHMRNPDRQEVVDLLAGFVELAGTFGLETRFEPVFVGGTRTLQEGAALIRDAGVDAKLTCDFLHLMRTGGSPEDLAAMDPGLIANLQICDGPLGTELPDPMHEGAADRLYPGEGAFPIRQILDAAPASALLGLEAPSVRRSALGLSPVQQAKAAMDALRPFLESQASAVRVR